MEILVQKCPFTGKLFEDRADYVKHLNAQRNDMRDKRRRARERLEFTEWKSSIKQCATLDDIVEWLNTNYFELARRAIDVRGHFFSIDERSLKKEPFKPELAEFGIEFESSHFVVGLACTHNAPEGVQSIFDSKKCPRYPGYSFNIVIKYNAEAYRLFSTDILKLVGINSGSGGGGYHSARYDCRIYLEDFPRLKDSYLLEKLARP